MGFQWNNTKKVEKLDRTTRKPSIHEVKVSDIVKNPNGFRQEDIILSLCLCVSEIIETLEAQAAAQTVVSEYFASKKA